MCLQLLIDTCLEENSGWETADSWVDLGHQNRDSDLLAHVPLQCHMHDIVVAVVEE